MVCAVQCLHRDSLDRYGLGVEQDVVDFVIFQVTADDLAEGVRGDDHDGAEGVLFDDGADALFDALIDLHDLFAGRWTCFAGGLFPLGVELAVLSFDLGDWESLPKTEVEIS